MVSQELSRVREFREDIMWHLQNVVDNFDRRLNEIGVTMSELAQHTGYDYRTVKSVDIANMDMYTFVVFCIALDYDGLSILHPPGKRRCGKKTTGIRDYKHRLKAIRKSFGYTQQQMADKLQVKIGSYMKMESARMDLSVKVLGFLRNRGEKI